MAASPFDQSTLFPAEGCRDRLRDGPGPTQRHRLAKGGGSFGSPILLAPSAGPLPLSQILHVEGPLSPLMEEERPFPDRCFHAWLLPKPTISFTPQAKWGQADRGSHRPLKTPTVAISCFLAEAPACRALAAGYRAGHPHSRACPGGAVARLCSASMCHRPGECSSLRGLLLILKGWAWAELGKGPARQNTGRLFYGQQTSVCRLTLAGHGVHGLAPSAPRPLFLPAHGGACGRMSPSLACPRFQPPKPGGVCGGPWVVTAGGSFRETGCPLGARASPCVSPSLIVIELRASASPSFPGPRPGPP